MSDPFHLLKREHRIIEQALRGLAGLCLRLEIDEPVPTAELEKFVDFITNFADGVHHGKEETWLFPALDREGISIENGPLGVLEAEHELERELVGELTAAIEEYRGGSAGAGPRFADVSRRYIDLLTGHMQREDNVLFRIGSEVLPDEKKSELAKAFNESAPAGQDPLKKYAELATELEEKWSI